MSFCQIQTSSLFSGRENVGGTTVTKLIVPDVAVMRCRGFFYFIDGRFNRQSKEIVSAAMCVVHGRRILSRLEAVRIMFDAQQHPCMDAGMSHKSRHGWRVCGGCVLVTQV